MPSMPILKNTLEQQKDTLLRGTLISPRDGWHSQQLQRGTDASGLVSDKTGVTSGIDRHVTHCGWRPSARSFFGLSI